MRFIDAPEEFGRNGIRTRGKDVMRVDIVIPYRRNDHDVFSKCFSHLLNHHCIEIEDLARCTREITIDIVAGISIPATAHVEATNE